MNDFLAMGGYGNYVWPAYVISFVVLAGLVAFILRKADATRRRLAELERRKDGGADG